MADRLDTPGDWTVQIDDDVPNMVALKFAEADENGVFGYQMYLPPDVAIEYGKAVIANAQYILESAD